MTLAIHIADGVLRTEWWVGGWVVAAAGVAAMLRLVSERDIARLAMVSAVFFVTSSVHLPLAGGRVHLLLPGFIAAVAGPAAALAVFVGLLLQTMMIGHGGITTLGVNAVCMGLPAAALGAVRDWPMIRRLSPPVRGFLFGCVGVVAAVGLGAAVLALGAAPGVRSMAWPFAVLHIPIALFEGLITAAALRYVDRPGSSSPTGNTSSSGTSH
jgi:cobalt/nickel transport system permease protein